MSADSEHSDILRRGPRAWNAWRAENPSIVPNLVGIALSIGDRQMGPINGGPINFADTRLRHAVLRFATLTRANLERADLADADLREARLEGANLAGADLSDAALAGVDFSNADLTGANLCGADLSEVRNLTAKQLHAAEGDASTVLPPDIERPLIWTVAQSDDAASAPIQSATPRVEEAPRERVRVMRSPQMREEPKPQPPRQPEPVAKIVRPAPVPETLPDPRPEPHAAARDEPPPADRHITWLVGGPRGVGRPRRSETSYGGSDGR